MQELHCCKAWPAREAPPVSPGASARERTPGAHPVLVTTVQALLLVILTVIGSWVGFAAVFRAAPMLVASLGVLTSIAVAPVIALAAVGWYVLVSATVAILLKRLHKKANQTPEYFPDAPIDVIREHVWVAPYYEEDIRALADLIGANRVLFGSDWPHGEGLAVPVAFVDDLKGFSDSEIASVMRTNTVDFLGYNPAN
jgi:hypothetical protein